MEKQTAASARETVFPLMFEMGRIIKGQFAQEDGPVASFLHCETLRFIGEQKSPTMREVADYLKIAPPTATALITSFVDDGILDRVPDAADRRLVRLSLSRKGKTLLQKALEKRKATFSRLVDSLSDKDCRELARILTIMTRTA